MKVLYLVTKSERGGAQVHVLDLIRTLRDRIEPIVACGDDGFLTRGVPQVGSGDPCGSGPCASDSPVARCPRCSRGGGAAPSLPSDIIHGHTGKAGLIARLAGWLTQTPALYTVHSWSFVGTSRPTASIAIWLERAVRFAGGTSLKSAIPISPWRADAALSIPVSIS